MKLTVLGGCGSWPTAEQACSGYLVEHDGFRLLIDPGYATLPRLPAAGCPVEAVDAVLVSHGHPDHCADLNPLLRARQLGDGEAGPLPLHAPRGALDAVLALDKRSMLAGAYRLHEFWPAQENEPFEIGPIGPFQVAARMLPHFVPNAGLRLTDPDGTVLVYTGDSGPDPALTELARDADLFLCEATYVHEVPDPGDRPYLMTAALAGQYASRAGARELLLTHLWPGTEPADALAAAGEEFAGPTRVAAPGLVAYPAPLVPFTWRRLAEDDFPLLRGWLERPHVARWWHQETSAEAVARDFGPAARGEEPSEDLLAQLDGRPVGLVQRCRLADYPGYHVELAAVVEVPDGAMTLDYLIGDPELTGRGLGPRMIASALRSSWQDHPDAPCVLVPVQAGNRASWRALEKAGLRRVAEGELEPDNPADGRDHYVYRIDRP